MKTRHPIFLVCVLFLTLVSTRLFAAIQAGNDWNVAVLDQLLASLPPGQSEVQIGDMVISTAYLQGWRDKLAGAPQPNVAFAGTFNTWPSGIVYYTFDASVSSTNQQVFIDSANEWATFANVHFISRTAQANYIIVTNDASLGGGLSYVGMKVGPQLLQIGPTAWNHGTVVHEIGHALGLVHEHQRSDRDGYVTILTNNIGTNQILNFVKLTDSQNKSSYDFLSVMHYRRGAFAATNGLDTIVPLPAYQQYIDIMGQQFDPVLSTNDRSGMIQVYGAGPGASSVVTNTADSGPGTLRAALYYAFDHPGTTITFNIPTSDPAYSNNVFNILPSDGLTSLWGHTTLDGNTEPTHANPSGPQILLNGLRCQTPSVYCNGLRFRGTNSIVRGLIIMTFPEFGVMIDGSNTVGNTLSGCYIGTDPTGTVAKSNYVYQVQISGGTISNIVGGTTAAARNVISGGTYQGLVIRDTGTRNNVVEGNYLGLNAAGTAALPNGFEGIEIFGGAQSNLIGGYTASAANVIAGNTKQGVLIADPTTGNNIVAGNYIGLNTNGTAAIPNGWSGVEIFNGAYGTLIGGTAAGAGNVISGNLNYGILTTSPTQPATTIQGNFIGLNAAGTAAIGNTYSGIGISAGSQSNLVGGTTASARNVISGNLDRGIVIALSGTSGNIVRGNYIGLNAGGTNAVANIGSGIDCFNGTTGNLLGGTMAGAGNVISGNTAQGVILQDSGTTGNVVQGNLIGLNAVGTSAIGNGGPGLNCFGGTSANLIGGNTPGAGNVISGNLDRGIFIQDVGTSGNVVQGNLVGLNAAGTAAVPNALSGIEVYGGATANQIGGYGGARNFISGNAESGILIDFSSAWNLVQGNTIGFNISNNAVISNGSGYPGLLIYSAPSNTIGGVTLGAANLISGSLSDGVQIYPAGSTNDTVRGNSIFNNTGTAIGLYGGNNNLAAPILSTAVVTTNTAVSGTYTGLAGKTYLLDFYADAPPAASAESMTYLGSIAVIGTGSASAFTANLGVHLPASRAVTATATDPFGNTSQLSTGVADAMASTPNDGIPDAWRKVYFGGTGTTTNAQSDAFADPDHDGMSNYQEFLAGTNPTNAASAFTLTALNPKTATNAVSLNSAAGPVYRVLATPSLTAGIWSILADQVIGTGTNMLFYDPAEPVSSTRFYRAEVLY